MPDVELGTFLIRSFDPDMTLRGEIGPRGARPIDGYGGWAITGRPKMLGLTEWGGRNPYAFELDFWLDNFDEGNGEEIERKVARLERMAGVGLGSEEPPLVVVDGGGVIPHDLTRDSDPAKMWVIENLQFNAESDLRGVAGNRVRTSGLITFRQYIRDDILMTYSAAEKERKRRKKARKRAANGRGGSGRKRYTVKRGDTLSSIAAQKLGRADRWREIADLNNIRDPRNIKVGRVIKLP